METEREFRPVRRLLHDVSRTAGLPSVSIVTGAMDVTNKAESDGVYTFQGGRFKVRAGGVYPRGAVFISGDKAAAASTQEDPKWYLALVEKADGEIPPRLPSETQREYLERAGSQLNKPSDTTEGEGPADVLGEGEDDADGEGEGD